MRLYGAVFAHLATAVHVRDSIAFDPEAHGYPHSGPYTTVLLECAPWHGLPLIVIYHAHGWN